MIHVATCMSVMIVEGDCAEECVVRGVLDLGLLRGMGRIMSGFMECKRHPMFIHCMAGIISSQFPSHNLDTLASTADCDFTSLYPSVNATGMYLCHSNPEKILSDFDYTWRSVRPSKKTKQSGTEECTSKTPLSNLTTQGTQNGKCLYFTWSLKQYQQFSIS